MEYKQAKYRLIGFWTCATFLMVWLIVSRYPGNHGGGYEIILACYFVGLAMSVYYGLLVRRSLLLFSLIFVGSIVLTLYLNRINIFLTYPDWIERGMPGWGMR